MSTCFVYGPSINGELYIDGVPTRPVFVIPTFILTPNGDLVSTGKMSWFELDGTPIALPLPNGVEITASGIASDPDIAAGIAGKLVDASHLKALRDDVAGQIGDEVTARENADTTLLTAIGSEATTRAAADTALGDGIDALSDTVAANADIAAAVANWPVRPGEVGVTNLRYYYGMTDRYGAPHVGDATVQLQNTIDSADALGVLAYACGNFTISAKVVFKGHADFSGATFSAPGTLPIAVEASTGGATDTDNGYLANKNIKFPTVLNTTKPALGWVGQGVGIRIVNAYSCNFQLANVRNFSTGVLFTAFGLPGPNNGKGNVYNTVTLGHMENNKVNLDLDCNAYGWVNENIFIGGRFSHYSDEGSNVAGTRHIRLKVVTLTVNNNVFNKPSIEGNTPEFHVENGGAYNDILNARWEASPPKVLYIGTTLNQGAKNRIVGGYGVDGIVFSYSGTTGGYNSHVGYNVENRSVSFGYRFQNGSSGASPIFTFFNAGTLPETAAAADWMTQIGALYYKGKAVTDAYERFRIENTTGRLYFGNGTAAPTKWFGASGADIQITNATLYPYPDNASYLGSAGQRWAGAYFGTAPVVTSDRNTKTEIGLIDPAALRAWAKVKYQQFKFKDSVAAKGNDARLHVGVIAQDVKAAFEAEGLDPFAYGILCFDKWDDKAAEYETVHVEIEPASEGKEAVFEERIVIVTPAIKAGERYGIRYDQAAVLEMALTRQRMDDLEAALIKRKKA